MYMCTAVHTRHELRRTVHDVAGDGVDAAIAFPNYFALGTFLHVGESRRQLATLDDAHSSIMQPEPKLNPLASHTRDVSRHRESTMLKIRVLAGGVSLRPRP